MEKIKALGDAEGFCFATSYFLLPVRWVYSVAFLGRWTIRLGTAMPVVAAGRLGVMGAVTDPSVAVGMPVEE